MGRAGGVTLGVKVRRARIKKKPRTEARGKV